MSKITTTTVAAAREPAVTRRRVLLGLGAATATAAVLAASDATKSEAAEAKISIDDFLARASASERARYHAAELAEAMNVLDPARAYWSKIDIDHGVALVVGEACSSATGRA